MKCPLCTTSKLQHMGTLPDAIKTTDEDVKSMFAQASLLNPRFKDFAFVKDAAVREEKRTFAEAEVLKVS